MIRIASAELKRCGGATAALPGKTGAVTERGGILVRVRDERGRVGLGEASPLPGYSPDTLAEAHDALSALAWDAITIDDADPLVGIARVLAALPERLPSARFAVETALLDLAGQRLGLPLHALLGGEHAVPVPLSSLIVGDDVASVAAGTREAAARGIRSFKRKLRARSFARDVELAWTVRRVIGPTAALRLDANCSFAAGELFPRLATLAMLRPEFVEEPLAGGFLAAGTAASTSPVVLAADESLQAPDAWPAIEAAIRQGTCGVVVLKPMALGGVLACLDLARRAQAAGASSVVTHLWDGPVALAAAAALAFALPSRLAAGLDRHPGLAAWPAVALPFLGRAELVPGRAPGLGLAEVRP